LKIFFFWNPAIYLWARQMAQLQELACDEAVVTHKPLDSHDYGYCLLRVAQATLDRPRAYLGTAGMSSTRLLGKSFLMRRIEMLNRYSKDRTRGGWLAIVSGALGLAGGALFADSPISAKQLPAVNPIVQNIADRVLHQSVTNARADAGFVIVSDVHSGQVLAVAYQGKTEAAANAIPRYLSQPMEPWSLIKPLIAAMAVDAGKTGVEDYHDCENGKLAVGNKVYTDDKPYTRLTTAEMIINSSNVCAIKVAETLGGSQALAQALTRLGFGSGSVVDGFPGAGPGTLASVDEQSDAQFVANAMFGFALRVTPLEMVQAYGAIANGGSLLQPQEYGAAHSPTVVRQPFSAGTAAQLRDVLARVVTEGTGKRAALARYTTAGKTGTGSWERVVDGRDHTADKTVVASFTGFAPAKDPQIVVYVSIENPRRGQLDGGTQAAPVFATIADQTLTALQIPSDRK
jgi:cell division protein FtsI (penicillin-binding protein 3)